ncbi:hypothetical protein EJ08DRAFT_396574 [Tothia fuscella]|uniref:Fungal N-terminal domain-containing protein n=1 Tax=Tothia fuscella TaxID=1048955 RepID=A0A9P4TUR0_9PEZI|nr:hypothetical protein EJ08DRAFT_396574 [Tothia fuscella]
MADLLSLIASAITVAGTAFAIARGLATLADALASFGEEVRALSSDIESFAKLVKNVQVVVSSIRRASTVDQGLIRDALDICILVLRPLNNMQRMLNKFKDKYCGNNVQFKRFKAITRWLFRTKRRLLFFWNAVQAQHHLLDTTLELMILKANLGDNVRADIKLIYREALAVAAQKLSGSTASQLLDPGFVAMKTLSSGSEDTSHPRIMIEQACMDSELNLGTNDLSPDGDHERQPSLTTGVFAEELDDLELELLTVLGTEGDEVELEIMEDTRALSRKTLRLANVALRNDNAGTFEDMKERHQRAERATLSSVQPVLSIPQAQPKAQTDIKGDILLQDSIRRKFVIPKIDVQTWQVCITLDVKQEAG